jgi:hypothetical protein
MIVHPTTPHPALLSSFFHLRANVIAVAPAERTAVAINFCSNVIFSSLNYSVIPKGWLFSSAIASFQQSRAIDTFSSDVPPHVSSNLFPWSFAVGSYPHSHSTQTSQQSSQHWFEYAVNTLLLPHFGQGVIWSFRLSLNVLGITPPRSPLATPIPCRGALTSKAF